jgi:hypothetical protein
MSSKRIVVPARNIRERERERETLESLPLGLHPAINSIAAEIATTLGWAYPENYDFLKEKNPRAVEMCRLAIISLQALDVYCLNTWGTSLDDLIREEE